MTTCVCCGFKTKPEELWHQPTKLPTVGMPVYIAVSGKRILVRREHYVDNSTKDALVYIDRHGIKYIGRYPWMVA